MSTQGGGGSCLDCAWEKGKERISGAVNQNSGVHRQTCLKEENSRLPVAGPIAGIPEPHHFHESNFSAQP